MIEPAGVSTTESQAFARHALDGLDTEQKSKKPPSGEETSLVTLAEPVSTTRP